VEVSFWVPARVILIKHLHESTFRQEVSHFLRAPSMTIFDAEKAPGHSSSHFLSGKQHSLAPCVKNTGSALSDKRAKRLLEFGISVRILGTRY